MTQKSKDERDKDWANRAIDAWVFKRRGVSPTSRWAKNYSKMMRQPMTDEEWRAFQEKLKDPKFAEAWMDKVVSGWPRRKPSTGSKRRSIK